MSAEVADSIFSTPIYPMEAADVAVGRRILVIQDEGLTVAQGLKSRFAADGVPLEVLLPRPAEPAYEERLAALLGEARVGTRVYVCGDEAFLWHVRGLAHAAGLLDEEIELFRSGARRKLYCVHCSTMQDIGAEGESTCTGCGVRLFVRNHFSRRLGAYMGVCLDADDPRGEGRA